MVCMVSMRLDKCGLALPGVVHLRGSGLLEGVQQ